ncbi:hypothetical protein Tco_1311016 [Tanacetum coccineum]
MGDYEIWAYEKGTLFGHTDDPISGSYTKWEWSRIITTDIQGQLKVFASPKLQKQILAKERERKQGPTLLMAHQKIILLNSDNMTDAKEIWMPQYLDLSQVSLIMITNLGVDSLSFDDLYNNLRVFESDVKGSTASSSSPQNVAFVSKNTSSTNDVSTAYCVPNPSGQKKTKLNKCESRESRDYKRRDAMEFRNQRWERELKERDSKSCLNHLIRDCDFNEKRMARKDELNNGWNNVQRVNKQNKFVPSAVLTRTMYKEEEQVFLDELEKLKRQQKRLDEEAEALRKEYAQETENLVIQAEAAKASSTNLRGKKRRLMRKLKLSRRSIYKKLRT